MRRSSFKTRVLPNDFAQQILTNEIKYYLTKDEDSLHNLVGLYMIGAETSELQGLFDQQYYLYKLKCLTSMQQQQKPQTPKIIQMNSQESQTTPPQSPLKSEKINLIKVKQNIDSEVKSHNGENEVQLLLEDLDKLNELVTSEVSTQQRRLQDRLHSRQKRSSSMCRSSSQPVIQVTTISPPKPKEIVVETTPLQMASIEEDPMSELFSTVTTVNFSMK